MFPVEYTEKRHIFLPCPQQLLGPAIQIYFLVANLLPCFSELSLSFLGFSKQSGGITAQEKTAAPGKV